MTNITIEKPSLSDYLKGETVEASDRINFIQIMTDKDIVTAATFERFLYNIARKMSDDYNGGKWQFIILDDDKKIFYLYPEMSVEQLKCSGILNYAHAQLSPRELGIIVTLLASAWFGDSQSDEAFYEIHHRLYDYIKNSEEQSDKEFLRQVDRFLD